MRNMSQEIIILILKSDNPPPPDTHTHLHQCSICKSNAFEEQKTF